MDVKEILALPRTVFRPRTLRTASPERLANELRVEVDNYVFLSVSVMGMYHDAVGLKPTPCKPGDLVYVSRVRDHPLLLVCYASSARVAERSIEHEDEVDMIMVEKDYAFSVGIREDKPLSDWVGSQIEAPIRRLVVPGENMQTIPKDKAIGMKKMWAPWEVNIGDEVNVPHYDQDGKITVRKAYVCKVRPPEKKTGPKMRVIYTDGCMQDLHEDIDFTVTSRFITYDKAPENMPDHKQLGRDITHTLRVTHLIRCLYTEGLTEHAEQLMKELGHFLLAPIQEYPGAQKEG